MTTFTPEIWPVKSGVKSANAHFTPDFHCHLPQNMGWISASIAIAVWGVTFASTRALLEDFSALEILVLRFSLAWAALWGFSVRPQCEATTLSGNRCKRHATEGSKYCSQHAAILRRREKEAEAKKP